MATIDKIYSSIVPTSGQLWALWALWAVALKTCYEVCAYRQTERGEPKLDRIILIDFLHALRCHQCFQTECNLYWRGVGTPVGYDLAARDCLAISEALRDVGI